MSRWSGIRHIIFDADDTLWKNNFYFVEATEALIAMWKAAGMAEEEARRVFLTVEKQAVRERGYGSENFLYILEEVWRRLSPRFPVRREYLDGIIDTFKEHRQNGPLLFDGVTETLERLGHTHELYVLTKGQEEEQRQKIIRSGIDRLVKEYFIVPEKEIAVYRRLLERHNWPAHHVCMVGNSPRSDINPALACGMHAVYIPYEHTWHLDHDEIEEPENPRLRVVKTFRELSRVF